MNIHRTMLLAATVFLVTIRSATAQVASTPPPSPRQSPTPTPAVSTAVRRGAAPRILGHRTYTETQGVRPAAAPRVIDDGNRTVVPSQSTHPSRGDDSDGGTVADTDAQSVAALSERVRRLQRLVDALTTENRLLKQRLDQTQPDQ